jgi:hypothetical protein
MLQYIYKPVDAGLADWPSGTLRLEGIEVTEDPNAADVFVCPGTIRLFEASSGVLDRTKLDRLPHFKGKESRNVFFDVSDNFTKPIDLPILFIRCDVRTWMIAKDPNTIQMGWPVEDYAECVAVPEGGFKFDVGFQGWLSSPARTNAVHSIQSRGGISFDYAGYTDFFGYRKPEDPEYTRRRAAFRRSMKESRVSLCPESIPGVLPYRFLEAMSAGRCPVLVGWDYVLPFADEIPYDDFILRCSTADASNVANLIRRFIDKNGDAKLVEMGLKAREYWVKWLNPADWPRTMAYAVAKKIGVPACV